MHSLNEFKQFISNKIKEIDAEYKTVYQSYEPTALETKLITFLDDIWGVRFQDEALNSSLKNASVQLAFIDKENPQNFLDKDFRLSKLHPKQKKTTPLYFLIARLAPLRAYNFFLCPNIFVKSKEHRQNWERFIAASNCYFVDIDEVQTTKPIYNCTETEIIQYLYKEYPLLEKCPPSYITMSGGGLHLYFTLEHTEYLFGTQYKNKARGTHRTLTSDYIKLLNADKACKNLNRLLRVPFSVNMKYAVKTKFYCYDKYQRKYNYQNLKETAVSFLPDSCPVVSTAETIVTMKNRSPKVAQQREMKNVHTTAEYRSLVASNARKTLFENRRADLEKWFFSHLLDMNGYRHKFFLIYSVILKNQHNEASYIQRQCCKLNNMLSEPLPDSELIRTIDQKTLYQFRNETIADWLDFTQFEIEDMSCHYGTDAIAEYHRQRAKYYNSLQKEERRQKNQCKKEHIFKIIADNPDLPLSKLAELIGCHKSSAFRWKRKYEESL